MNKDPDSQMLPEADIGDAVSWESRAGHKRAGKEIRVLRGVVLSAGPHLCSVRITRGPDGSDGTVLPIPYDWLRVDKHDSFAPEDQARQCLKAAHNSLVRTLRLVEERYWTTNGVPPETTQAATQTEWLIRIAIRGLKNTVKGEG